VSDLEKINDEIEYLLDFTSLSLEDIAKHVNVNIELVRHVAERIQIGG